MATYEKLIINPASFQEGNLSDITITFDNTFPLTGCTASCEVRQKDGTLVMRKKSITGGIVINSQVLSVIIEPADTVGKAGSHNYEIDIINSGGKPFATIGGRFTVKAQVNTNG